MAHLEQRNFCIRVKERLPEFFKNKKVLDIGSLDINGSNRFLFEDCNYLGIDVGEGRNVDYVSVGHLFDGPDNYFDTIISTEVFEHDMFYEETIKNIMRMLKPGGLFLFTCAAPGRPEHGTRRCGEDCAPLLIQISEDWADYYKNLDENDIRQISGFNETFPDGYFELNNIYCQIPADLYFYGVKGGEKYLTSRIKPEFKKEDFAEHIFVVDCWPDNESKEQDLIKLIKTLKIYNIPILLTGHFAIKPEIQKMVDYYIFDKNNPLLLSEEFIHHGVGSGRWTEDSEYMIQNAMEFHHDYAIWETMRNAFNFCKYLGKKYIHFLEYDNLPHKVQYRQTFLERIKDFDAVLYEYSHGSSKFSHLNPYCATYIFSIRTDFAILAIDQIKSKYEYFTNKPKGWQLERVFLDCLRKFTNRIHITEYITNENEFNTQAVWNRDGMSRNGAIFQVYPAVDFNGELYMHLISGFSDIEAKDDYLLELRYENFNKFVTLKKGHMMNVHVGKYKKGSRVKIYYKGNEVYSDFLGKDLYDFIQINKIIFKNQKIEQVVPKKLSINFVDGAFVEILDEYLYERKFDVSFIDQKHNQNLYGSIIKNGWWTKTTKKYFIDWNVKIKSDRFDYEYRIDLSGKRVLISFESKSLGDTLAWIPYVDEFRKKHNCQIICSTFFNDFLSKQYSDMEFVLPGTTVNSIYAMYSLGLFYKNGQIDVDKHPTNPLKEPLAKIASDILGLDYVEIKPKLPILGKKKNKRVCIGVHSTAQTKYWNNPNGWQDVVNFLISNGYEVRLLSKEEDGYMGNSYPKGVTKQPPSDLKEILKTLQESEFFIGISSGLSWLAWAANIPVVLISGFTDDYLEPKEDVIRIIKKDVCHGCWHNHKFDPGDWNWCPEHKGTERQFECTKLISSEDVIDKVKALFK